MLDIKYIRENPELVAKKSTEKGYQVDITQLLGFDQERRELIAQVEETRRQRNEFTAQIKGQKPSDEQLEKGRQLRDYLSDLEHRLESIEKQYIDLLSTVPNVHFDDVPVGDESNSAEISKFGEQNTGAKDHLDLLESRGLVDFERGAKVAGAKFYFRKGDLALLENALTQYALNFIIGKGFTFVSVPNLVNSKVATGTGFAPRSSEQSDEYFIEGEDLSLIATAEMPLTCMHANEIIDESNLPLMYVALSPCYRKEAGSYGKHTRGLFRVHQFNKLEMYVYSTPEKSAEVHAQLLALEEELWKSLNIPYRVINIASGDLGAASCQEVRY
jgi:seryl-tRNA synthetase